MDELTHRNFGLLIAYVLPGFVTLSSASYFYPELAQWFATAPQTTASVGSFFYVIISSLAVGLIVSAVRWATIDQVNEWTGLRRPKLDFTRLQENLQAFDNAVVLHYNYYQFYSNMAVALACVLVARWVEEGWLMHLKFSMIAITLEVIILAGARDALRKYYERLIGVLGRAD